MAQGLLKQMLSKKGRHDIQVLSAGVSTFGGLGATPETIEVMKREEVDVSGHIGQPITPELIRNADIIFCMEDLHRDAVLAKVPETESKIHLLKGFQAKQPPVDPNIPDPIGRPKEVYESCLLTIKEAIERVAKWVEKQ
jgi:protein-tyrosine-phosphatase